MSDLYVDTLANLYAKKREIDQAIKSLEAIRGWTTPAAEEEPRQKTLLDAILGVLRERNDFMSAAEIVTALDEAGYEIRGADKHRHVGARLSAGKKQGHLVSPERAKWGLPGWENRPAARSPDAPTVNLQDML